MLDLKTIFSKKEFFIFKLEIQNLFSHRRRWHFMFLFIMGVCFVPWVHPDVTPFLPVMFVVFCGLELQYDNLLFRSKKDFEAYLMFPINWEKVILAKNIATIVLTIIIFILASMSLLYFSPATITLVDIGDALLYLMTVIFVLLQYGNLQSVRSPRRVSGLQVNDLIEAIWMLINLLIFSLPYYFFVKLIELPALCVVYSAATAYFWRRNSITKTAEYIKNNHFDLCKTE
jgi:hypothetical protein